MPRNSSGLYQLPAGSNALPNTTIESAKYNALIADVGSEITASLPRDGRAGMSGALKLLDGTLSDPSAQFTSAPTTGFFYDTVGSAIVFVIGGVEIARFNATGVTSGLPVGTPVPVLDDTLPALCLWADGRNVSRTTYAALFAKWASKYGAGDGSTTFGIPDLRGRSLLGRDNIGGTDAARLVSVFTVSGSRLTTGGILGEALHTLSVAETPSHSHGGITSSDGAHAHTYDTYGNLSAYSSPTPSSSYGINNNETKATSTAGAHSHTIATNAVGGGGAHNNVHPSLLCNWVIYAGA